MDDDKRSVYPNSRQMAEAMREVIRQKAQAFADMEIARIEKDYDWARERARLSVLNLTEKDKCFLREMRIKA